MTRKEAIAIIAKEMVRSNGGAITKAQAVRSLGPWYSDEKLVATAREIQERSAK
jgi:hypothetical protein